MRLGLNTILIMGSVIYKKLKSIPIRSIMCLRQVKGFFIVFLNQVHLLNLQIPMIKIDSIKPKLKRIKSLSVFSSLFN